MQRGDTGRLRILRSGQCKHDIWGLVQVMDLPKFSLSLCLPTSKLITDHKCLLNSSGVFTKWSSIIRVSREQVYSVMETAMASQVQSLCRSCWPSGISTPGLSRWPAAYRCTWNGHIFAPIGRRPSTSWGSNYGVITWPTPTRSGEAAEKRRGRRRTGCWCQQDAGGDWCWSCGCSVSLLSRQCRSTTCSRPKDRTFFPAKNLNSLHRILLFFYEVLICGIKICFLVVLKVMLKIHKEMWTDG